MAASDNKQSKQTRAFNAKNQTLSAGGAGNNNLEPKGKQSAKVQVTGNDKLDATPKVVNPKGTGGTLQTGQKQVVGLNNGANSLSAEDQNYRIDRDVRTLHDAHQIRNDGQRHARAKARIKDMMKAVGRSPKVNADDAAGPDSELPQN